VINKVVLYNFITLNAGSSRITKYILAKLRGIFSSIVSFGILWAGRVDVRIRTIGISHPKAGHSHNAGLTFADYQERASRHIVLRARVVTLNMRHSQACALPPHKA
jgi:hypothetical protein